MMNGIGQVYTYRKQNTVNHGYGYYDPTKVFTKFDENGKVNVDGTLCSICKQEESNTVYTAEAAAPLQAPFTRDQTLSENARRARSIGKIASRAVPREKATTAKATAPRAMSTYAPVVLAFILASPPKSGLAEDSTHACSSRGSRARSSRRPCPQQQPKADRPPP